MSLNNNNLKLDITGVKNHLKEEALDLDKINKPMMDSGTQTLDNGSSPISSKGFMFNKDYAYRTKGINESKLLTMALLINDEPSGTTFHGWREEDDDAFKPVKKDQNFSSIDRRWYVKFNL